MRLGLHVSDFTWPGGPNRLAAWSDDESSFDGTHYQLGLGFSVAHGRVMNVSTLCPITISGERVVPAVAAL